MRKQLLIVFCLLSLSIEAQFVGKIFQSEHGRNISFIDSTQFILELWENCSMKHYIGSGTYSIIGNNLIAELKPHTNIDSSFYKLKESLYGDSNFISIECKYQIDSIFYSCESINYWITSNNIQIGKRKMIGKSSKISIKKVDIAENSIIHFSGLNTHYNFPIKTNNDYIVILKRNDFQYIENGKLIFKILKKKNKIILKLINGKNYIGSKVMDFF